MSRSVAFLRAINVGGHTVTMAELKKLFEKMGFKDVTTFIASGNVVFAGPPKSSDEALEKKIAAGLERSLGYPVATFVRSVDELAAIAAHKAFPAAALGAKGAQLYIGFLQKAPAAATKKAILAMQSDVDSLNVHGRELYWLGTKGFHEAVFQPGKMERSLKIQATFRNITTIRKMVAKFGDGA